MALNITAPEETPEMSPRLVVLGLGGAGGNAVNNMVNSGLEGVEFIAINTDAQALKLSQADRKIQLGIKATRGLGAGARPERGREAAEEGLEEIMTELEGANMIFIAAGMGGGTGTGAAPVIAREARARGILTVGVVTKPFEFEGRSRMLAAEQGIEELQEHVDTLIVIPNQNLFRLANEKTTFGEAFMMADSVLQSGVRGVTDLMVFPGLINLDFADIHTVMSEMGQAMMGTGQAEGEHKALRAAESAISNPLLDGVSMRGAKGVLINITGGLDMTLMEVDEAANRIRQEVEEDALIIFGSSLDQTLEGAMRVTVVATGMTAESSKLPSDNHSRAGYRSNFTSRIPGEGTKETIATPEASEISEENTETTMLSAPSTPSASSFTATSTGVAATAFNDHFATEEPSSNINEFDDEPWAITNDFQNNAELFGSVREQLNELNQDQSDELSSTKEDGQDEGSLMKFMDASEDVDIVRDADIVKNRDHETQNDSQASHQTPDAYEEIAAIEKAASLAEYTAEDNASTQKGLLGQEQSDYVPLTQEDGGFIPPMPEDENKLTNTPDPFKAAAFENGGKAPDRIRTGIHQLWSKMLNSDDKSKRTESAVTPIKRKAPPSMSGQAPISGQTPETQNSYQSSDGSPKTDEHKPELFTEESMNNSRHFEDEADLEIPAFLRRQAN